MKRTIVAVLVLGTMLLAAWPARADTITQLHGFSAGTFDAIGVTPFDPSLGTLDRVLVNIAGGLTVTGVTGQNALPTQPPTPVPYSFQVEVSQEFFGLAGKYFEFLDPARLLFLGSASGAGEAFALVTDFTYDLDFTALTDLVGFTLPVASATSAALIPPFVGGLRSDFLAGLVPIDEIDLVQQAAVTFSLGQTPTVITAVNSIGTLQIVYDYTPAPVAVSGPATLLLLGVCAAALGVGARRRRRR